MLLAERLLRLKPWLVVYLQLLLQQRDLGDARLSGLVGLLHLSPLSRQAEADVLQLALQLGLLIVLDTERERRMMLHTHTEINSPQLLCL